MQNIVAIVGMAGSGKSEATAILEENGYSKIRYGQLTIDELNKKGLDVNEKNEREMRELLRKEHGMAAYAKLNIPKIDKIILGGKDIVLDGLYSWEEFLVLKEKYPDMAVLCINASPSTRYSRLGKRIVRPLSKEEAFSRDKSEIENLHKAGPIAMADLTIINEKDLENLKDSMIKLIKEIKNVQ